MTLTETLVKKELEKQTGKRWERKVFNENGKDSVIFVAEEDKLYSQYKGYLYLL